MSMKAWSKVVDSVEQATAEVSVEDEYWTLETEAAVSQSQLLRP